MTDHERLRSAAQQVVVFTGAGISGDAPSSLPRGFGLRNRLVEAMYDNAVRSPVAGYLLTPDHRDELVNSGRKLEVVLGRLWGTIGDEALGCLLTLAVDLPNRAHLLAAVHLAHGGTHLTLNLDVAIELAYDLLTGRRQLPAEAPSVFHDSLGAWRRLVPSRTAPLRVVAARADFDAWAAAGSPPALLKLHGSLSGDQTHLVDVVVVDVEELGQLSPGRGAGLRRVAQAEELVVTGYSGGDPDVHTPLFASAPVGDGRRTRWHCLELPADSPVRLDALARGVELRLGKPEGLAVTALMEALAMTDAPPWAEVSLRGPGFAERFAAWERSVLAQRSPDQVALAWAWLAADLGDLDLAVAISTAVAARGDRQALLRAAEVLYTRARGGDRDVAGRLFRRVARLRDVELSTRAHCLLRAGDIARGRAARGGRGFHAVAGLTVAFAQPLRVLWLTRGGRRDTESAADAFRAMQQTGLRLLERLAVVTPTWVWPVLAVVARSLTVAGRRAEALATNGNRRALVRQHRMLLTALAALLAGTSAPPELDRQLRELHHAYRAADDLPGAGNCTAARAVVAAAQGDRRGAGRLLDDAAREYAWDGDDRPPLASGAALIDVLRRLLVRRPVWFPARAWTSRGGARRRRRSARRRGAGRLRFCRPFSDALSGRRR